MVEGTGGTFDMISVDQILVFRVQGSAQTNELRAADDSRGVDLSWNAADAGVPGVCMWCVCVCV